MKNDAENCYGEKELAGTDYRRVPGGDSVEQEKDKRCDQLELELDQANFRNEGQVPD